MAKSAHAQLISHVTSTHHTKTQEHSLLISVRLFIIGSNRKSDHQNFGPDSVIGASKQIDAANNKRLNHHLGVPDNMKDRLT